MLRCHHRSDETGFFVIGEVDVTLEVSGSSRSGRQGALIGVTELGPIGRGDLEQLAGACSVSPVGSASGVFNAGGFSSPAAGPASAKITPSASRIEWTNHSKKHVCFRDLFGDWRLQKSVRDVP